LAGHELFETDPQKFHFVASKLVSKVFLLFLGPQKTPDDAEKVFFLVIATVFLLSTIEG